MRNFMFRDIYLFIDTNSSIFSYIRHRQYLLFIYALCILIIIFLVVNTIVVYSLGNILGSSYMVNSSFNASLYSCNSMLFSYLILGNVYDFICSFSIMESYDSYLMNLSFLPSVGGISHSSYFLSYNLYGWFETCGSCSGRSNLGMSKNNFFDEVCCMGLIFDNLYNDLGSFTNLNNCSFCSNNICLNTFAPSTPYMYEDCGLLKIKYLYTNLQNSLNSYLSNFVFYDPLLSNLLKFKNSPILEIFKLDMLFDSSGYTVGSYSKLIRGSLTCFDSGYGAMNIHRINSLARYDSYLSLPIDTSIDLFNSYGLRNSGESLYLYIPELSTQVVFGSDHLFDLFNIYGNVCATSCNDLFNFGSFVKIKSLQHYCYVQLNRIGTYGTDFFYNKSLTCTQSSIKDYVSYSNRFRLGFDLIPDGLDTCNNYVIKDSDLYLYFYDVKFYLPDSLVKDYLHSCNIDTYYSIFYDYTHGLLNIYSKCNNESYINAIHSSLFICNDSLSNISGLYKFTVGNIIDDFYVNFFSRFTDGLLINYKLSALPSLHSTGVIYMDHPKYYLGYDVLNNFSICDFILNCEFDVISPCSLDGVPNLLSFNSDVRSNFEFLDSDQYSLVTLCYGYGVGKFFIFSDNFTYIVENSSNILVNIGFISSLIDILNLNFYSDYTLGVFSSILNFFNISILLKFICILYPFIFIILSLFLVLHILYAYEFLLNDYIECIQFRKFISFMLLLCVIIYIYIMLFNLYIDDFYGLSLIFGNTSVDRGVYDLFCRKDTGILNIDEEFVSIYIYNKFIDLYLPSNVLIGEDTVRMSKYAGLLLYFSNIFGINPYFVSLFFMTYYVFVGNIVVCFIILVVFNIFFNRQFIHLNLYLNI